MDHHWTIGSMASTAIFSAQHQAVAARLRDTDAEVRKEAVAAVAELAPGNRTQAPGNPTSSGAKSGLCVIHTCIYIYRYDMYHLYIYIYLLCLYIYIYIHTYLIYKRRKRVTGGSMQWVCSGFYILLQDVFIQGSSNPMRDRWDDGNKCL